MKDTLLYLIGVSYRCSMRKAPQQEDSMYPQRGVVGQILRLGLSRKPR
jgi:hypothetical protein